MKINLREDTTKFFKRNFSCYYYEDFNLESQEGYIYENLRRLS